MVTQMIRGCVALLISTIGIYSAAAQGSETVVVAINAGGERYTNNAEGIAYLRDTLVTGGSTYRAPRVTIAGASDPEVYLTERWGAFSYAIPLPNGNYSLTLRFAEIYWNSAGSRVFNVVINGQPALSQYDIFAEVGKNAAVDKIFPVSVTDGFLNVSFRGVVDNAKLSALIVRSSASGVPTIYSHPSNHQVLLEGSATFQVSAIGAQPLAYQWLRDGAPLAGATSATLTLTNVAMADSGAQFHCVVSNSQGTATSNSARLDVMRPVPPSITQHPASQSVVAGQSALFSVTATGSAPLSFQWQKNDVNIAGATSDSYLLSNASLSDNGATFRCIVTNAAASVTSNAAILSVRQGVAGTVVFATNAGGGRFVSPSGLEYRKDSLFAGGNVHTASPRPIAATDDDEMYLSERWGNFAYNVPLPSGDYEVELKFCETYWTRTGQRVFHVNIEGTRVLANFDVLAYVPMNTAYDRRFPVTLTDGSLTIQFTSVVDNSRLSGLVVRSMSSTSEPPFITGQPANSSVTEGQSAQFSVTAGGSSPLAYQWQKNGADIPGATASTYVIASAARADSGALFRAVVSNSVGSVASTAARLDVHSASVTQPIITTQPANQSVSEGQSATFSVVASGSPPLAYQWQRNGVNIAGANSSTYTIAAVARADSGALFRVIVSNSGGTIQSTAARLDVIAQALVPPSITSQPASQTVQEGQSVTFSVAASGSAPLSYQWQRNGSNISGATSSSYTFVSATAQDSGSTFRCVVSNSAGTVTSAEAQLRVTRRAVVQGNVVFATNSGGGVYTSPSGIAFSADSLASGGSTFYNPNITITGTDDIPLFRSERWGTFSYNIPLTNGEYEITLRFAEIYWSESGKRVFNVEVEGTRVLSNFDIFALVGKNVALDRTFNASVNDGVLTIRFTSLVDQAKTSGIIVRAMSSVPTPPTIVGHPASVTVQEGQAASFSVQATGSTPLQFQWQKNGANISGATSSTYTISSAQRSDSGAVFRSLVSNAYGSVVSNAALLSVNAQQTPGGSGNILFAINVGATRYVSPVTNIVYENDTLVTGGNMYTAPTRDILGTEDDRLYLSERWGSFTYALPVPNGEYEVELKFCETYWSEPGQRVFHVNIEAVRVLENFDILAFVPRFTAYDRRFTTTVSDGMLNVQFFAVRDNARLGGLVVRTAGVPTMPVITTHPASVTLDEGTSAHFSVSATGNQLRFQWQKNGVNIAGATGITFTTPPATPADNGAAFRVIVSNPAGTVTSNAATLTVRSTVPGTVAGPWWNARWRHRLPVAIGANGFARTDRVATVDVNFTSYLTALGVSNAFNPQSLRVVEVNTNGAVLDSLIVFQFDPATTFNPSSHASGKLLLLMPGSTAADGMRYFHIYFETASGFSLPAFTSRVSIADNVAFQGQASFRITNQLGTMWYHKSGGGFAGLQDAQGVEWIGYNSQPGSGGAGEYRGIPNLGAYGHPGYTNGVSTLVSQGPLKITIETSTTDASNARWVWEIYPTYQTMTLLQTAVNYWFLYEGIPGGTLNQTEGYVKTSAGQTLPLGSTFASDLPGPEWAYFGITGQQRFLYFIHHEDDQHIDHYRPFSGPMTVFGFGRDGSSVNRYMTAVPQRFTFGFGEQEAQSTQIMNNAFRDVTVGIGTPETFAPPVITQHPANKNVGIGQTATFTVSVSGVPPITYQWQKNGTNIAGATSSTYVTPAATRADSGAAFRCVVSNAAGSVVSNSAILRVVAGVTASLAFRRATIDANPPTNPHCKELADINGDGFLDVLAASSSNINDGVFWYQYPTWTKTRIAVGSYSTSMATGDVDGDGDKDVIIPKGDYYGHTLYWYENPLPTGNPTTSTWPERLIGSASVHDIVVGDVTRDGKLDVVVRVGNATTLFVQSLGVTWTKSTINTRPFEGTALGDIDGDGDLDVVTNGYWLENPLPSGNPSAGLWTERVVVANWSDKSSALTADIDGDGKVEIILAPSETPNGKMSWFKAANPKTGPWVERIIDSTVSYIHTLKTADVDNNGLPDLFTAEMHQSDDPDEVSIYLNFENGTQWRQHIVGTTGSHNAHIGDIDGDGDLDLFGANWNNEAPNRAVLEWWQNVSGNILPLNSWQRHVIDANRPWRAIFVSAADVDGDAFKDIVAGGWWYKNPGRASGSWTRNVIGSPLNNMAALFDVDNDGSLDVLGTKGIDANRSAEFVWGKNNGRGGFTILQNISAGEGDFLQGIAVGRFTFGGPLEAALSWHEAGRGVQMLTVPSNPAVTTWGWRRLSTTSQDEQLSAGDIDRDGDDDLLLGTKWLRNDGGSWTPFTLFNASGAGQTDPDRNRLADMNADGRLDAVVGYEALGTTGKLAWYEQPSTPTNLWQERVIATNLVGPMSLDVADMDGDGDPDIVVGEHNYTTPSSARMIVFENENGVGTAWRQYVVYTGDEHHDGAFVTDIDNDGDLDIVSVGWYNSLVLLYENRALQIASSTQPQIAPVKGEANGLGMNVPTQFMLHQNYPNPFNPTTEIRFDLPEPRHVVIRVFDVLGRSVATLVDEEKHAGRHSVRFNASALASGTYIYRMQAGAYNASRKFTIVR